VVVRMNMLLVVAVHTGELRPRVKYAPGKRRRSVINCDDDGSICLINTRCTCSKSPWYYLLNCLRGIPQLIRPGLKAGQPSTALFLGSCPHCETCLSVCRLNAQDSRAKLKSIEQSKKMFGSSLGCCCIMRSREGQQTQVA
jgi:hypothetical protein